MANNLPQPTPQGLLPINPSIGGLVGNAVGDVGNIARGLFALPGQLAGGLTNPNQGVQTLGNMASGIGQEYNNLAGQPFQQVNGKTDWLGGVNNLLDQNMLDPQHQRMTANTISHLYQHPVNSALDIAAATNAVPGRASEDVAAPGTLQKMARSVNQTSNIKLPSAVGGAQDEEFVQNVLNNEVPGSTLAQKYANLQPAMDRLGGQIQDALSSEPKDIAISDVQNALNKRMQPLVAQGTLTQAQADSEVGEYITRIYGQANPVSDMPDIMNQSGAPVASASDLENSPAVMKGAPTANQYARMGGVPPVKNAIGRQPPGYLKQVQSADGAPVPEGAITPPTPMGAITPEQSLPNNIGSDTAFRMKQIGNHAAGGLFGKENLSPSQATTLALRNGMDDVITKYYPNVKDLTRKQSALFQAADEGNLGGLRGMSTGIGLGVPGTNFKVGLPGLVGTPIRGAVSRGLNAIGEGSSLGKVAPATGLGLAGVQNAFNNESNSLQNAMNNGQQEPNNAQANPNGQNPENNIEQIHDYTQIPQTVNQIKPDQTGNYSVASPYTITGTDSQAIGLSPASYTQQIAALNQAAALPQNQVWPNSQKIQSQIDSLNTKYQESKPLGAVYTAAQTFNNAATDARQVLQTAPPSFFQAIPTLDALRKSTDPKYAALQSDLSVLESKYPINLQGALTPQVLESTLNKTNQQFLNDYYQYLNNYVGSAGASNGGNAGIAQTQASQLPAQTPTGLAPIQQGGAGGSVQGTGSGGFAGLAPLPGQ